MKARKSGAVAIFIGVLLIVIFVVGLVLRRNPSAFMTKYRYDFALELPAGIIGIPLFLISLITSLVRESKEKE